MLLSVARAERRWSRYGDMVPQSHTGRTVAVLAMLAGLLYTAVLVAMFSEV